MERSGDRRVFVVRAGRRRGGGSGVDAGTHLRESQWSRSVVANRCTAYAKSAATSTTQSATIFVSFATMRAPAEAPSVCGRKRVPDAW